MPIVILLVLGLVFGLLLSFASKKFYVEPDTRVDGLINLLPGANCGACGYPGCQGLAEAMVYEGAEARKCIPTKDFTALDAYVKEMLMKKSQEA